MASTEQDKNLKEFVLRVPEKLLRCKPYVHTDCHFRFDACFREIRAYFDVLRILKTSK